MKKYTFSFTGRQTGAIGIFYKITQEYSNCDNINEAVCRLFKDYEHFTGLTLNGKPFKILNEHFNHPAAIKYEGLGSNRK